MSSKRLILFSSELEDLPWCPFVHHTTSSNVLPVEPVDLKKLKKAHAYGDSSCVSPDDKTLKEIAEKAKITEYDCFNVAKAADAYCWTNRHKLGDDQNAYFDMWHAQFAVEMEKVKQYRLSKRFDMQLERRLTDPRCDPRNFASSFIE